MKHILLATSLLLVAGCRSDPAIRDDPTAMTGVVVARDIRTPTTGARPTIHVKETPDQQCGVIFGLDSSTVIRRRISGDSVRAATVSDFEVGTKVRIWSGPIAESCPAQGLAQIAEILP